MKSAKTYALCMMSVMSLLLLTLYAQGHGAKMGDATATVGGGKVSVKYGRPELNGRNVKELLGVGKLWRMGKDIATELTSEVDLEFGGKKVPKGKYTLAARKVDQDKWNLLILSKGNAMRFDPEGVVAEVPMLVSELPTPVELQVIELAGKGNNGTFTVMWGTLKASVDFKKG